MARILSSNIIKLKQPGYDFVSPLVMDVLADAVEIKKAPSQLIDCDEQEALPTDQNNKEEELKTIKLEAYNDGFAEGEKTGKERGLDEIKPVVESFVASIEEIAALKNNLYEGVEVEVADLIMAAVTKIVQRELELDREIVARVIKNALKEIAVQKEVLIRLNPKDYFYILDHKERLFVGSGDLKNIKFKEDDLVGIGGCLIESGRGEVDARIEKQLEKLEAALKSVGRHE